MSVMTVVERKVTPTVQDRLPSSVVRVADLVTQFLYRMSDGRIGTRQMGHNILLLTCTGRKTGKQRVHTLAYTSDGQTFMVVASNNGELRNPSWYLNLQANPQATIQYGRHRQAVVAHTATGDEHRRLWAELLREQPHYENLQAKTTRQISLVVLTPVIESQTTH